MARRGGSSLYVSTDPNSPVQIGTPGVSIFIGTPGPTIYAGSAQSQTADSIESVFGIITAMAFTPATVLVAEKF